MQVQFNYNLYNKDTYIIYNRLLVNDVRHMCIQTVIDRDHAGSTYSQWY